MASKWHGQTCHLCGAAMASIVRRARVIPAMRVSRISTGRQRVKRLTSWQTFSRKRRVYDLAPEFRSS